MKTKRMAMFLLLTFLSSIPIFASTPKTDSSGFSPIEHYRIQQMKKKDITFEPMASQSTSYTIPGNKGTIKSNAWRSTYSTKSGNTLQWDYQVSAVYTGSWAVEWISTTWQGSASLRNSASLSLGVGIGSVSAGSGSSWQSINTVSKYWKNSNGSKESSYRSNMIVTPAIDYRKDTISIVNTATVKLREDPRTHFISAGA